MSQHDGRRNTYISLIHGHDSFPRKNADLLKKFRTRLNRPATQCTAAVFHPTRRTTRVHHKKGRPRAATSHESRLGKPSFCTSVVRTRPLVWAETGTLLTQSLASS